MVVPGGTNQSHRPGYLYVARCHKLWREQGGAEEARENVSDSSSCAARPDLETIHLTTQNPSDIEEGSFQEHLIVTIALRQMPTAQRTHALQFLQSSQSNLIAKLTCQRC